MSFYLTNEHTVQGCVVRGRAAGQGARYYSQQKFGYNLEGKPSPHP